MPKTRTQSILFTAMMAFCMVYCMTTYSIVLRAGGFHGSMMGMAIREMWVEYPIVFCLVFFIMTKLATRLAFRFVTPGVDKPIFVTLAVQSMMVCLMVPTVTFLVTFLHNGLGTNWLPLWIQTAVQCFPFAFCIQVFFVGPLVRHAFAWTMKAAERLLVKERELATEQFT